MNCPKCNSQTRVLDTRRLVLLERRRECPQGHRFWTQEVVLDWQEADRPKKENGHAQA
jgi:transcriptional regulator NrdR family protein